MQEIDSEAATDKEVKHEVKLEDEQDDKQEEKHEIESEANGDEDVKQEASNFQEWSPWLFFDLQEFRAKALDDLLAKV